MHYLIKTHKLYIYKYIYEIAEHDGVNILNKRSEVVSKCRHKNKYVLAKLDSND